MPRIGVFVCECGPNIKDAIDIPELVRFCRTDRTCGAR